MTRPSSSSERPAVPGDLCTCGRAATVVFIGHHGEVGWCGWSNGGAPPGGWCVFCDNQLTHPAVLVADDGSEHTVAQAGRCPRYRLRLDDDGAER